MGKEKILAFSKACHTVSADMLNTMAAVAFLVGFKKEEVYPERKSALQWQKLKTVICNSSFFEKVDALELDALKTGLTSEQKLAFIKGLIPNVGDEAGSEKAKELDPAFEVIWFFM